MKILLDESVPQKLRLLIDVRHTVFTTDYQGWSGLKNGALITEAEAYGFALFITADQELSYQLNLTDRRIAILVLSTNNSAVVRAEIASIAAAIERVTQGSLSSFRSATLAVNSASPVLA